MEEREARVLSLKIDGEEEAALDLIGVGKPQQIRMEKMKEVKQARLGQSTVAVVVEARLGQTKGAIGDLSAFDCKAYEEDEEVQQRLHRRIEELRFGQNTRPLLIKNKLGRRGRRRRVRRQIETEEMLSLPISPLGRSRLVVWNTSLSTLQLMAGEDGHPGRWTLEGYH
ncbi:hypothetical protein BHM03_00003829 [Ensete ventricosum]|uniref:Uncharacterized protein n=1 Tax=Ensete ventricosum TaxID=4639 RepID=A0A445MA65_ENSVE|nr:hypothetical protein BHM03_00003829 [Ensete ventricosum]